MRGPFCGVLLASSVPIGTRVFKEGIDPSTAPITTLAGRRVQEMPPPTRRRGARLKVAASVADDEIKRPLCHSRVSFVVWTSRVHAYACDRSLRRKHSDDAWLPSAPRGGGRTHRSSFRYPLSSMSDSLIDYFIDRRAFTRAFIQDRAMSSGITLNCNEEQ